MLGFLLAAPARAQSDPAATSSAARQAPNGDRAGRDEAVRFRYSGPPDCPDEAAFVAQVRRRTSRGTPASEGELARTFTAEVRSDANGYIGLIEFLDDAGAPVNRRVHGEQCEAVVSSLALIVALSLDASLKPEAAPTEPAATPSVPLLPKPPVSAPPRQLRAAPRSAAKAIPVRGRIGIGTAYDSGLGGWMLALLTQLDRPSYALRFAAHYEGHQRLVDTGRRARLRTIGVAASGCTFRFARGPWALAPCVALDLGTLRAEGLREDRLVAAGGRTIFWAALAAELRLAWEPPAPLWLELQGTLSAPLVRHSFVFDNPPADVFTVPVLFGGVGGVVGVRF